MSEIQHFMIQCGDRECLEPGASLPGRHNREQKETSLKQGRRQDCTPEVFIWPLKAHCYTHVSTLLHIITHTKIQYYTGNNLFLYWLYCWDRAMENSLRRTSLCCSSNFSVNLSGPRWMRWGGHGLLIPVSFPLTLVCLSSFLQAIAGPCLSFPSVEFLACNKCYEKKNNWVDF